MAEELKIKIRNTEAASVEIVPTYDGIEISIIRKENESFRASDNLGILKAFCGRMKKDDDVDQKELLKFYKFYEPRMNGWKNKVDPEKLWDRWNSN